MCVCVCVYVCACVCNFWMILAVLKEYEEDRKGKKQHQAQKKELEKMARENEELKERLKDLSSTVMSNIVLQTQTSIEKSRYP